MGALDGESGSDHFLAPLESLVQTAHGDFHIRLVNHHRVIDFQGRDDLDIDAIFALCVQALIAPASYQSRCKPDRTTKPRPIFRRMP
ncbi:hypothetical protein BSY15_170 [Acidovorax sp. RAC01]|nr:hypothetical protein BSY15_170 [Acidovorax sp. RAC01]